MRALMKRVLTVGMAVLLVAAAAPASFAQT